MDEQQKNQPTPTMPPVPGGDSPVPEDTPPPTPPASPSTPLPDLPPDPAPAPQPWVPQPKKSMKWMWLVVALVVLLAAGAGAWFMFFKKDTPSTATVADSGSGKTRLVYAVHWLEDQQINGITKDGELQSKGLRQYLDEYEALHDDLEFTIQQIPYNEYEAELKTLHDSGAAPDIYQIYSPWGASYVRDGMLAEPPEDLKTDIAANYISTAGPTIDGKVWGIPTEINNYALLYNKELFKAAGIVDAQGNAKPPTTWAEVLDYAKKLTKKDAGAITQYGFAFLRDNDWQAVDPFLSLLFSNGGQYLSTDLTKSMFNSPEGVAALDAEVKLFTDGSTDTAGNFYDFGNSKVAMVVSPPWTKANFAEDFGDKFETTVGVAPLPFLKSSATLSTSWFAGVMQGSTHQQEAWDFLEWFTTEVQEETGTTRYGDLLANTIGAIPSRKVDFDSHKDVLGDFFTSVFVQQMANATAEPNVLDSGTIKSTLMTEIQAAWDGKKSSKDALDSAATAVDKILQQNSQ